jgi:hypothetical protein
MLPLGRYVALGEPEAKADQAGRLHVLWRMAPRHFGYVTLDPFADVLDRAVYTDVPSPPHLAQEANGQVSVQGGRKTHPKSERVLTEPELASAPPTPPPPAPPKKWWQFWRRQPKPAGTK